METAAAVISGGVSKDSLSPLIDPLGFFATTWRLVKQVGGQVTQYLISLDYKQPRHHPLQIFQIFLQFHNLDYPNHSGGRLGSELAVMKHLRALQMRVDKLPLS